MANPSHAILKTQCCSSERAMVPYTKAPQTTGEPALFCQHSSAHPKTHFYSPTSRGGGTTQVSPASSGAGAAIVDGATLECQGDNSASKMQRAQPEAPSEGPLALCQVIGLTATTEMFGNSWHPHPATWSPQDASVVGQRREETGEVAACRKPQQHCPRTRNLFEEAPPPKPSGSLPCLKNVLIG
ncbi:Transcription Initiation Factor Iib [Manis pentadactyla]|nr:Transcription Initiation Factor Iib [Manis pentadactyla]